MAHLDISTLNDPQRRAVEHGDGPLLLLAGAGSGKTRVITFRIAHLVLHRGVPPEQILAVTFTNKAAREMKERVADLVGASAARRMTISTFHALCANILRSEITRLGYRRNFTIFDAADQLRLVRDILSRGDYDAFGFRPEQVLWFISDCKNRLVRPGEMAPAPNDPLQQVGLAVYPDYQRGLKTCNAVDFDDLLLLSWVLFEEHPEVLEAWRRKFRHILVDEYQDTNLAQYRLLRQLAQHGNLCVVGDDDQSIYGWRGANLGNILEFERDFPGTTTIRLEQNYRSTATILEAANAVICRNSKRKEKALWTSGGSGEPLELLVAPDDEEEARMVAGRIQAERQRGRHWKDMAVLYRTNSQSRPFEEQLRFLNIPYRLVGGQQFFDRKEVKDALAYLKLLCNPQDEVSLLRIINYPRRGIGTGSIEKLIDFCNRRDIGLWEGLRRAADAGLSDQVRAEIGLFVRLIDTWRYRFEQADDLRQQVEDLFAELGLEAEILRTANSREQGEKRCEFLQDVLNAVASYQAREAKPTLAGFVEKVSLLDDDRDEEEDGADAVTLMSLHASKGLEFPVVFLVGMEEGYLPHRKSHDGTAVEAGYDPQLEEERRLCYVGITRAREHLVLSRALRRRKRGRLEDREPSRFLAEIPEHLFEHAASPEERQQRQEEKARSFFATIQSMFGTDT
ncbi:MAG: ATP-dependent DNA helicase Rep [Deltaproteobacteria bacterium]|nr:MAG: ATP-dependent DNA helicase Rep [Deltaproteobacteria bacterium]